MRGGHLVYEEGGGGGGHLVYEGEGEEEDTLVMGYHSNDYVFQVTQNLCI